MESCGRVSLPGRASRPAGAQRQPRRRLRALAPGLSRPNLQLYFSPLTYLRTPPGVRPLMNLDPFPDSCSARNPAGRKAAARSGCARSSRTRAGDRPQFAGDRSRHR
jgi:hypothetical protein